MARTRRERIDDILEAIADIRRDAEGLDAESFERSPAVVRACLFSLVVIGEAVKRLPDDVTAARPDVPWRDIAGLRNLVVHEYFRADPKLVWDVIAGDLDALETVLGEARKERE